MNNFLRIAFFIFVVHPLLIIFIGLNVFNRHNLPRKEQFILIANHNSHLDTAALLSLFPLSQLKNIRPVAASDYFLKNKFVAWLSTTLLNILPIPRAGFSKSNNPISMMSEALERGESLILFPEGSRGEPEKMDSFKTGIAHLIKKHPQVPVLPMFLKGMGKSLPRGEALLIPFFCDVVIGKLSYFAGSKEEIVKALEDSVNELRKLIDENYETVI